jgi:hypothetical protein
MFDFAFVSIFSMKRRAAFRRVQVAFLQRDFKMKFQGPHEDFRSLPGKVNSSCNVRES